MFLLANVLGSSIQISTLPLPVLSTLQASGLVFNSICASLILGEPFTRWSLWGTLLVCSGAVLIAIFGAIPAPAHDLNELLELLVRPPFVAWMSLQTFIVLSIAISVEVLSAVFATLAQTSRFRLARGLAYGIVSGILSAHSLLVAKSAVELLVRTIVDGNNQFRHWQAWGLVVVFVTLALTQLYYLHRGLKLVSTSVLYPLVFCIYNIIAILDGLIYFRQTDLIGPIRACLISLGTVILLSGVLALSWRLSDEQHQPAVGQSSLAPGLGMVDDTEGEDDEEALLLGSDVTIADGGDEERHAECNGGGERSSLLPKSKFVSSYHTFGFNSPTTERVATDGERAAMPAPKTPTSPKAGRRQTSVNAPTTPGTPSHPVSRWSERAEIWDELEDQDDRRLSSEAVSAKRHRNSTIPVLINDQPHTPQSASFSPLSPFSAARKGVSTGSPSLLRTSRDDRFGPTTEDAEAEAVAAYQRSFRRRRKTTGFAGFQARRMNRKSVSESFVAQDRPSMASARGAKANRSSSGGLQDALGGLWRMGWWNSESRGNGGAQDQPTQDPAVSPVDTQQRPSTPASEQATAHDAGGAHDGINAG